MAIDVSSYYNVGSKENLVVSHSAMNMINPLLGGHPKKFMAYFKDEPKEITISMERGNLFHKWLENPDAFKVSELDKPTPQMALFGENFYSLYFAGRYKTLNGSFQAPPLELNEIFKINEIFEVFHGKKGTQDEISLLINILFYARKEAEVNATLKPGTVIEKFQKECINYIKFLHDAGDRIIIDKTTKDILEKCKENYLAHPFVKYLTELKLNIYIETYKEKEFFWTDKVHKFKRKAKIDFFIIDKSNKRLIIVDNKTNADTNVPFNHFERGAMAKYDLDGQLVNYVEAIESEIDLTGYKIELYNIVSYTTGEFPCIVYKLSIFSQDIAQKRLDKIKERIAYHILIDNWELTKEEIEDGFITI